MWYTFRAVYRLFVIPIDDVVLVVLLLDGSQTSGSSHLAHQENQLHGSPRIILPAIEMNYHLTEYGSSGV